jgi:hypothetical protein
VLTEFTCIAAPEASSSMDKLTAVKDCAPSGLTIDASTSYDEEAFPAFSCVFVSQPTCCLLPSAKFSFRTGNFPNFSASPPTLVTSFSLACIAKFEVPVELFLAHATSCASKTLAVIGAPPFPPLVTAPSTTIGGPMPQADRSPVTPTVPRRWQSCKGRGGGVGHGK